MTTLTERRTRSEQIGDILTAIEHLWKMQPQYTFGALVKTLGAAVENLGDDDLEAAVRGHLQALMRGARDRT